MSDFDHILNWKLLGGSHCFPGPDGGTCINEAAIVACGFPYQRVSSVKAMPDCFSRPICHLAMQLNDNASSLERQRLMPFVTRLACADTPEVEQERASYIKTHTDPEPHYLDPPWSYLVDLQFERGLGVLEGALAIGRQAEPLGLDQAASRLDAARGPAKPVKKRTAFFAAKMKGWLVVQQVRENVD